MITIENLVKIPKWDVKEALEFGECNPETGHANPMTGILRSAGRWILDHVFQLPKAEPLILRMQTTQVIGRRLYVPEAFIRNCKKKIVAIYVHMSTSRLATIDSVKGITVAGWALASDLRTLHTSGTSMICVKNDNVLNPMDDIYRKE